MNRIFRRRISSTEAIFRDHYIDVKSFYVAMYGFVPSVSFIGDVDAKAVFTHFRTIMDTSIDEVLQHSYYDHEEGKMFFNNTIIVMKDKMMAEIGCNYCQVLHRSDDYGRVLKLITQLSAF